MMQKIIVQNYNPARYNLAMRNPDYDFGRILHQFEQKGLTVITAKEARQIDGRMMDVSELEPEEALRLHRHTRVPLEPVEYRRDPGVPQGTLRLRNSNGIPLTRGGKLKPRFTPDDDRFFG